MTPYQTFFTNRPTQEIAQTLLGKVLRYDGPNGVVSGYIVETEAYLGQDDSAAHAFKGRRTAFTEPLYGPPATIYIYQLHRQYMFDIAVQDQDVPQGVLIRAIEPKEGLTIMQENRPVAGVNITNGPGKLMQALGVQSKEMNMQPLEQAKLTVDITDGQTPANILSSARIGVNADAKTGLHPYRYYVAHNPYVSQTKKRDMDFTSRGWS